MRPGRVLIGLCAAFVLSACSSSSKTASPHDFCVQFAQDQDVINGVGSSTPAEVKQSLEVTGPQLLTDLDRLAPDAVRGALADIRATITATASMYRKYDYDVQRFALSGAPEDQRSFDTTNLKGSTAFDQVRAFVRENCSDVTLPGSDFLS